MNNNILLQTGFKPQGFDTTLIRSDLPINVSNAVAYYQDWQFYLTLLTVMVAIAAIFLPEFFRRRKEDKEDRRQRLAYKMYFKGVIKNLAMPIERQSKAYEDFANLIRNIDSPSTPYPVDQTLSILKVFETDHQRLFKMFNDETLHDTNFRLSNYQTAFESIQWISSQGIRCRQNFDSFFSDLRIHEREFRAHMDVAFYKWDIVVSKFSRGELSNEEGSVDNIREVIHRWRIAENSQSYSILESLLLKGLEEAMKRHFNEQWVVDMYRDISNALSATINIHSARYEYADIFIHEASELKERYRSLELRVEF